MAKFNERLRQLRTSKDLSQAEFAKQISISKSSVNMYERGEREPNFKILEIIADYFNVDMDYLLGKSDTPLKNTVKPEDRPPLPASPNIHPLPPMKQWKVLGGTACGQPLFKPLEDASVLAPADIDADFVFRCIGDSMINARIFDGDAVFIKEGDVPDGQIGIVRVGEEYTLKRIYHGADYLELRAENPMYPPIIIRGEQENAQIVGRAVQFLSRVI